MKNINIFRIIGSFSLLVLAMFAIACSGGSANSGNAVNSNASNKTNSNSTANQTTPVSVDTTPVTMDREAFDKADTKTLESYKGRTMIIKYAALTQWNEDKMTLFPKTNIYVWCNGDFSSYSEAIKKYASGNKYDVPYADVKGTVKEIETRSETIIKMENCTLLKLEK